MAALVIRWPYGVAIAALIAWRLYHTIRQLRLVARIHAAGWPGKVSGRATAVAAMAGVVPTVRTWAARLSSPMA